MLSMKVVHDCCGHLFNCSHLETSLTEGAEMVYEADPYWIAPPLWKEEYANVLAKLARKEGKSQKEIISHFEYTLEEMKELEREVSLSEVLKFAMDYKISVYDAHFAKLADVHQVPLITEDKEILAHCPKIALSISDFIRS